jgi:hypothetical protein
MPELSQHLTTQLKGMNRQVDAETGAILFRHLTLLGIKAQLPVGVG